MRRPRQRGQHHRQHHHQRVREGTQKVQTVRRRCRVMVLTRPASCLLDTSLASLCGGEAPVGDSACRRTISLSALMTTMVVALDSSRARCASPHWTNARSLTSPPALHIRSLRARAAPALDGGLQALAVLASARRIACLLMKRVMSYSWSSRCAYVASLAIKSRALPRVSATRWHARQRVRY